MGTHKRTEITVETNEIVVVRRARFFRGWCAECGCEVDLVAMPDARAVAGISGQNSEVTPVQQWHVCEGQDSGALVCLESLLKSV